MKLSGDQRDFIANALQDVLEEAKQKMNKMLKEAPVKFDSVEQGNEFNFFAQQYFYKLRIEAPSSLELIDYKHPKV